MTCRPRGSMVRMESVCCVRLGEREGVILVRLEAVRHDSLHWPTFPDRSACSVRCKTGESGWRCPIDVLCRNADRLRSVLFCFASCGYAAKGQFKRDILFEQGRFRRIVGGDEADIDGVLVGPDLGYAQQCSAYADPQHLRYTPSLHLLESALMRSEVKDLAVFAQQPQDDFQTGMQR